MSKEVEPENQTEENAEPQGQTEPQGNAPQPEPQPKGRIEPQGEQEPHVDWKAEARKWEARAKENKAKADETNDRVSAVEAELEKTKLVMQISRETGVPPELIHGDTADELAASAKAASEWAASMAPGYPSDKGGSATAPTVTRESIEQIKDPIERIRARAEHADLYR